MLNEETVQRLHALKLTALLKAWASQQLDPSMTTLSFDERLALLVEAEILARDNAKLVRNLRDAKLKLPNACIEDIDYAGTRGLERPVVRQLATCAWVRGQQNITITGATGTGKTYLGCAFGQQACRQGFRTLYRRASRFFDELTLARADGSYGRLLDRIAKIDLLIIDDWGTSALAVASRHDLLEVIDDRTGTRSTIITSQLPVSAWHDHMGDPTVADAVCDRLLHRAHRIELKGPSRRRTVAVNAEVEA